MQSDHHHLNSDSTSHRSIISKPIPPPISIIPLRSNHSLEQADQYSTQNEEDHNMTARCSQFPPDILNSRSISSSHDPIHSSSRFSSFLNNLNNEPSTWSDNHHPIASSSHQTQSFRLDSPVSASTNELSSSCSSLASSNSAFLPSTSKSSTSLDSSKFDSPPSHQSNPTVPSESYYPSLNPPSSNSLQSNYPSSASNSTQANYPPTTPQGYPTYQNYQNLPPQPRHSLPIQYPNPGSNPEAVAVAPPAAAFTPSDGSPPLLPPNLFCADSGSRRHTVSAFMAPSALEIGLFARHDLEDTMLKEEKRRRNKESSQRFRDRTRERQREKQERLEFLERRIKDLEIQLVHAKRNKSNANSPRATEIIQPPSRLVGENETALTAMQRLHQENESLRAALKTAEQEIQRLSPGGTSAFSIAQVYGSLPQLSPPASTGGESSSPPTAMDREHTNYFTSTRTSSPSSDHHYPQHQQQQHQQAPQHLGLNNSTSTINSEWEASDSMVNWNLDPHTLSPPQDPFHST
ncbi:uncharacterized protein MELLADRAFT_115554 [Melampsora larici-populina 98AG31]|uniref:BZIP domain-containing protein n=1 Tax=Melampsora larici-populina (strain 98AG31 / pathotype 3-4-7) TaxID=747676 RepID=F4RBJ5_MELLP|nr:uncharacterized protein MELLADRAFT_115554 [Melampsora larici-populina 98AG31]EGG10114.1 hypothetical protein MELLADRAFT_115554 [Melampsora larici-populina 98AG31]